MPTKFKPRRVRSEEDRNKGRGQFLTLKKTNDRFMGYALFVADPEREDNEGYYEYFEHYTPSTGYCPCVESDENDCPLCDAGDNASTRAKSVWLVVDANDPDPASGEVKIFNLNYYMIQDFAEDGGDMLGRLYSVKRLEGNGKYAIRPKPEKLKAAQLKAALKDLPDLEKITTSQAAKVIEEMDVEEAMNEDKDDKTTSARKGTAKAEKSSAKSSKTAKAKDEEPEATAFDPDEETEIEDAEVTVTKIVKSKNIATVEYNDATFDLYGTDAVDLTDYVKGQMIVVSAEKDDDGDFVVSSVEDALEPDGDGAETPESISDEKVTITSVNTDDETLTVEMEDGTTFELFFLGEGEDDNGRDWSELDLDDYKEGQEITISAAKDDDGDMLASVFPEVEGAKKSSKTAKKTGSRK